MTLSGPAFFVEPTCRNVARAATEARTTKSTVTIRRFLIAILHVSSAEYRRFSLRTGRMANLAGKNLRLAFRRVSEPMSAIAGQPHRAGIRGDLERRGIHR